MVLLDRCFMIVHLWSPVRRMTTLCQRCFITNSAYHLAISDSISNSPPLHHYYEWIMRRSPICESIFLVSTHIFFVFQFLCPSSGIVEEIVTPKTLLHALLPKGVNFRHALHMFRFRHSFFFRFALALSFKWTRLVLMDTTETRLSYEWMRFRSETGLIGECELMSIWISDEFTSLNGDAAGYQTLILSK